MVAKVTQVKSAESIEVMKVQLIKYYIHRFISEDVYPGKVYPTFCHGGMWTIPLSYVLKIKCVSEVTDQNNFYLEDVYITGKR